MSYKFVNRPDVVADITNAIDYYKKINPQLAKQFLFRIREAKSYIAVSPESFQLKYLEVRTLLLKQFPYYIHYLVDEKQNQIVILAIIHAYKKPENYTTR
jgi:plasmid stabilization system protein ParE